MTFAGALRRISVAGLALVVLATPLAGAAPTVAPVRVIVQGPSAATAAGAVDRLGGTVVRHLGLVDGVAASVRPATAARLGRLGFAVTADAPVALSSSSFAPASAEVQLQASRPGPRWEPSAGEGVGVALVDTGVADVPELEGRVVRGPDLSGEGDGIDRYGHGTFMAGLIAAEGTGLAPGSHVVSVKVAGADGSTSMSTVIEAIAWVIAHGDEHGVRVLNLSFGADVPMSWRADPLSAAVEAAWASGIAVVAAAGNEGTHVTSPGRDPWVLAVGATDPDGTAAIEDDTVPSWSGREERGKWAKPELVAPGVAVVSLRAPGSTIDQAHPAARLGERWFRGSGTSMATALTAGAAAVVLWGHPEATPDDVKGALVATADAVAGGATLDLAGALEAEAHDWDQELPFAHGGHGDDKRLVRMPWSGTRWSGTRWSGTRWSGTRWSGTRWSGTR